MNTNGTNNPTIDLIAKKISDLLAQNRQRSELVEFQTELIMIAVRAIDDDCPESIRQLLQQLIKRTRTTIDSRPKDPPPQRGM